MDRFYFSRSKFSGEDFSNSVPVTIDNDAPELVSLMSRALHGTLSLHDYMRDTGDYDKDEDMNDDLPDLSSLDLTELDELQSSFFNRINVAKKEYYERTQNKSVDSDPGNGSTSHSDDHTGSSSEKE